MNVCCHLKPTRMARMMQHHTSRISLTFGSIVPGCKQDGGMATDKCWLHMNMNMNMNMTIRTRWANRKSAGAGAQVERSKQVSLPVCVERKQVHLRQSIQNPCFVHVQMYRRICACSVHIPHCDVRVLIRRMTVAVIVADHRSSPIDADDGR
jgi:hypothetical protein